MLYISLIFSDLKLSNILLGSDGHCKVADFGLAKINFFPTDRTNSNCGTPLYRWWWWWRRKRREDKEEEEEDEVDDDDDEDQKLYNKIITEEVNFPKDLSLAAVSLVSKVSLITVKREALKCHSLSYAFECNLPYLVLNLQELYQFPQCCMCFVQFIKWHTNWNCECSSSLFAGLTVVLVTLFNFPYGALSDAHGNCSSLLHLFQRFLHCPQMIKHFAQFPVFGYIKLYLSVLKKTRGLIMVKTILNQQCYFENGTVWGKTLTNVSSK